MNNPTFKVLNNLEFLWLCFILLCKMETAHSTNIYEHLPCTKFISAVLCTMLKVYQ